MVLMLMLRTRKAILSLAEHRTASDLHLSMQQRQCLKVDLVLCSKIMESVIRETVLSRSVKLVPVSVNKGALYRIRLALLEF
jgi:hypothetical protein